MNKSTKYGTMETLEKIAEMLGVNLSTVEPLPDLTLDVDGVQGQAPVLTPRVEISLHVSKT